MIRPTDTPDVAEARKSKESSEDGWRKRCSSTVGDGIRARASRSVLEYMNRSETSPAHQLLFFIIHTHLVEYMLGR